MIITKVTDNGPADDLRDDFGNRIRLEPNDRILTINGQLITTVAQYRKALNDAPKVFFIRVKDKNVGAIGTFQATVK